MPVFVKTTPVLDCCPVIAHYPVAGPAALPLLMPAEALRTALAALHDRPFDADAKEDLHRHVCDYVDEAHAADWPPERMLIEVKKILRASGYRTSSIVSGKYREYRDALVEEIVHLCIVEYFDRAT